jgi:hypothetical protein
MSVSIVSLTEKRRRTSRGVVVMEIKSTYAKMRFLSQDEFGSIRVIRAIGLINTKICFL